MRGSDERPANVIVTVLVSYLIGLPIACCVGGAVSSEVKGRLGNVLLLAILAAALVVPGVVAWWWNYRRKPPTDLRPWV